MKIDSISTILEKTLGLIGNDLDLPDTNYSRKEQTAASILLLEKNSNKKQIIESNDFIPFQSQALRSDNDLYLNQIANSMKEDPKYSGSNNSHIYPATTNVNSFSFVNSSKVEGKKKKRLELKVFKSKRDKKQQLKGENYSARFSEKNSSKTNKKNRINSYKSSY